MSSTLSAMSAGLQGIQKGMEGLRKNAHEIATQGNTSRDAITPQPSQSLETSLVDMKANELQVQISAKVVQASSDMIGSLIDIKA